MQALSDEQRIDALEKKIDDGFTEMRTESQVMRGESQVMRGEFKEFRKEMREDLREVRGEIWSIYRLMFQTFAGLGLTMILGFAAVLFQLHF
ncbi:MAG TPA: hypothetical protein VGI17_09555 [Solirubrobacterales bacterium]